ncbi:hypothetical protein C0W54_07365 [Photobacterium kishitanii]|uniref:hypothetical protein n=1 Tax=Photobacterium kishitanii TaxID=318456 RepID=UPI000D16BC3C|nr:hypothetical protein [Photobacterium kishitanii]PSW62142.1 hypothetical protein C0W54_07365 [Photobacterium kishitanii]
MMKKVIILTALFLFSGCAKKPILSENASPHGLNVAAASSKYWELIKPGILVSPELEASAGNSKGKLIYFISNDKKLETKFVIFNEMVCNIGETNFVNTDVNLEQKDIDVAMKCSQPNTLLIYPSVTGSKYITNELIQNHSVRFGTFVIPSKGFIDGFSKAIDIRYGGTV